MLHERFLNSVKVTSVDIAKLHETLSEIGRNLKAKHPEVKDLFLFGSFARGDYTPESDLDILIVCSHSGLPFPMRAEKFDSFFRNLPFDVNLLVYTEEELHRMQEAKNPFILAVLTEMQKL
ncbi:MAG: nucleotidyltransferase domain-containing protein [Candidatus Caldatribacteriaceae bacterium]